MGGGLTTEALRPSAQRSEPDESITEYTASVMGPGASLGPQGCFKSLDELLECVKDNVENGSVVTVARVKGQV